MSASLAGSFTDTLMAYTATGRTRRHYLRKREKVIEEQAKIEQDRRNTLPESTGPSALKGNKRLVKKPKTSSNTIPGILVSVFLVILMASLIYYMDPEVKTLIPTRAKVAKVVYDALYRFVVGKPELPEPEPVSARHAVRGMHNRPLTLGLDKMVTSSAGRYDRTAVKWNTVNKGELATLELFLSSQNVDSMQCALVFADVANFFPPDVVRVHYHYLGGGHGRDQSANCVQGETECEGNKAGLCMQHYVKSVPPMAVLGCQAREPHKVPGNMEDCMEQLGVTEDEKLNWKHCLELGEGQSMFDIGVAYSRLVMPKTPDRLKGCTVRTLDQSGKEKSWCVRQRGVWDTSCGAKITADAWKVHLCMVLRMQARRFEFLDTLPRINEVCGLPGEEEESILGIRTSNA